MKIFRFTVLIIFFSTLINAQTIYSLKQSIIKTQIGDIAVHQNDVENTNTPIIFLHGVFFDYNLWENQFAAIKDRKIIAIDMPLHGNSKKILKENWTMQDCADMVLTVLDSLHISKVVGVGHSWGSMTLIRSANKQPEKFASLLLSNMPFEAPNRNTIRKIKFQHLAMIFRGIYRSQAAKSLFGKESLKQNPDLAEKLTIPMSNLSNKAMKITDYAVRIKVEDATELLKNLSMPIIAIVGEEDYVGIPPLDNVIKVKGGHISPLEVPVKVNQAIKELILSK